MDMLAWGLIIMGFGLALVLLITKCADWDAEKYHKKQMEYRDRLKKDLENDL